jgi:hypothetical protein
MNTRRAGVVVAVVGLALACRGAKPERDSQTDTARTVAATAVDTDAACAPGTVAPSALPALVRLSDPASLVRLPRTLWRRELNQPRSAVWVAPDLSYMLIVATDERPDMAAGGDVTGVLTRLHRPRGSHESNCRLDVDGRPASLSRSVFVDSAGVDTVFAVSATVVVRPGLAMVASGLPPARAMRDSLVAIIASVRFTDR